MARTEIVNEPVKRVENLPPERQCLRYPGFECNCALKDVALRKRRLKEVKESNGILMPLDWLDSRAAEKTFEDQKNLCEGVAPPNWELIKYKLSRIRIV